MKTSQTLTAFTGYSPEELQYYIHNLMLSLGIPDSMKGNRYLSYMVEKVYYDPERAQRVMCGLYKETADEFETKVANVERNCRTAISRIVSTQRYRDFCRNLDCFQFETPSVSNLVALLGDALRYGLISEEFLILPIERR